MKPLFAALNSSSTMDAYSFVSDAESRLRYEQVSAFNSLKQSLDSYADRVKDQSEKSEKQYIDLKNQIVEQNEKTDKQFVDFKSELFILKAVMVAIGAIIISLQPKVSDIISFLFSFLKLTS